MGLNESAAPVPRAPETEPCVDRADNLAPEKGIADQVRAGIRNVGEVPVSRPGLLVGTEQGVLPGSSGSGRLLAQAAPSPSPLPAHAPSDPYSGFEL